MPSKLNLYTAMFDEEAKRLSGNVDYFKSYLTTSARMYKYSFKDQVMIHAQRPDAVACAEYDTWGREDITNRYVKRGSKGIALIDDTSAKTRLRYVFDFADTGARDERSKEPFFWKITPETERLVADRLGAESPDLITALRETARTLAKEKSDNFLSQLMQSKEDSFLEELDDLNVKVRFEALLDCDVGYICAIMQKVNRVGTELKMIIRVAENTNSEYLSKLTELRCLYENYRSKILKHYAKLLN